MEEKLGDGPLGRILVDHVVAACHVLPDLWYHAAKPSKNGKVTLCDTKLALERVQDFSAQGSILALVAALYVSALVIIVQVISRANILICIGVLVGRVRVAIPIFSIILLWQRKQAIFSIARVALRK